jgi:two-component system cell cycle response regulator
MQRGHALKAAKRERPHFVEMCFSDPAPAVSAYAARGEDQRRAPRQRVLLSALVVHTDFNITFKCGIRDVSDEGARLKAPPGLLIPSDFHLIDIAAGKAYEARTAWRRYPFVGAAIRAPIDLVEPTSRLARRLRALWLGVIN